LAPPIWPPTWCDFSHPEGGAAIEQAAIRIRAAGIVTFDPAKIRRLVGLGFNFLGVGGGIASYAKAIRALAKEADAAKT